MNLKNVACLCLALTLPISSFATSNTEAAAQSVKSCENFSRRLNIDILEQGGGAFATSAVGTLVLAFAVDGIPVFGTTGIAAMSLGGGGVVAASVALYNGFTAPDFAKLAYELAMDEEGVVTNAYLSSCRDKEKDACEKSLASMKAAAKEGTMCQRWNRLP